MYRNDYSKMYKQKQTQNVENFQGRELIELHQMNKLNYKRASYIYQYAKDFKRMKKSQNNFKKDDRVSDIRED